MDLNNKIRKIIREELDKFELLSGVGESEVYGMPKKFYVVFTPSSSDSELIDIVSKVNYNGLYTIGKGTQPGTKQRVVAVYSLDKKNEAIEKAKEVLERYSI